MAIAFDSAADLGYDAAATSLTTAYTVGSGSNRCLIVAVVGSEELGESELITGVTYNGVAMTLIDRYGGTLATGNRDLHLYYLLNPAAGTNNVVVSGNTTMWMGALAASYTGVLGIDIYTVAGNFQVGTSATWSTTNSNNAGGTQVDNCWLVLAENTYTAGGSASAGTGATKRAYDMTSGFGVITLFDSNGPKTPAGSHSMETTRPDSRRIQHVAVALTPAPPPSIVGSFILGGTESGDSIVNTAHTGYVALDDVARTVSGPGVQFIGGANGFIEQAAAPAGIANTALVYAEDSGGKTRLMVKFGTGSAIQLAIEP